MKLYCTYFKKRNKVNTCYQFPVHLFLILRHLTCFAQVSIVCQQWRLHLFSEFCFHVGGVSIFPYVKDTIDILVNFISYRKWYAYSRFFIIWIMKHNTKVLAIYLVLLTKIDGIYRWDWNLPTGKLHWTIC